MQTLLPGAEYRPTKLQADLLGKAVDAMNFGQTLRVSTPDSEEIPLGELREMMTSAGLADIKQTNNSTLYGTKKAVERRPTIPDDLPKIAMVMSMPRLAFSTNMLCAVQTAIALKMAYAQHTGAFWEQCLTRAIQEQLSRKPDFLLVVDFDTTFTTQTVLDLLELARKYPDGDAFVPIQYKREEDKIMAALINDDGTPKTEATSDDITGDVHRIAWGHFGCTLIRPSAFEGLPLPWLWSQPAPDGSWGEGRVDADIYFWKHMAANGRKVYLANHVPIGHMQLVSVVPREDFSPAFQYAEDFKNNGFPKDVRR